MALQTQTLERVFRYNSVELADPGAAMSVNEVRDLYANTYPEIVNAAIEGPEEKDGKLVYTFRRAVGRKGALDVPRPTVRRLRAGHATVLQLLALAARDTDLVSFYVDGTDWSDANGAIVVIKGGNLAREIIELFERQGLVTPGKPVADPDDIARPGAAPEEERQLARRYAHALACLADVAKDVQPDGMGYIALNGTYEVHRQAIEEATALETIEPREPHQTGMVAVRRDLLGIVLGFFEDLNWPDTAIGNAAYELQNQVVQQRKAH